MSGKEVRFASNRVVKIGDAVQNLEAAGGVDTPVYVTFHDEKRTRGETLEILSNWSPGDPVWHGTISGSADGTINGSAVTVQVRPILNGVNLAYRGIQAPAYVYTDREAALVALMPIKVPADMSKYLLCPMPGLIKAVHVTEGQSVQAGDNLAIVEAMKMENLLRAERDGVIKKINAKAGDSLAVDAVILEFA
jgi:propionyl-CoA carboxylase alpha chain